MADNFHFDMTGVDLSKALDIAFTHHRKATGWLALDAMRDKDRPGEDVPASFVLFWTPDEAATRFPTPLEAPQVEPIVRAWLSEADYGHQPDHDGDNQKGWRVFNEAWGHVGGYWQAFCAIEPVWLMYGK